MNRLTGFTRFNATYAPVIAEGVPDDLAESFLRHIGESRRPLAVNPPA